jgi:hypothetical protein
VIGENRVERVKWYLISGLDWFLLFFFIDLDWLLLFFFIGIGKIAEIAYILVTHVISLIL